MVNMYELLLFIFMASVDSSSIISKRNHEGPPYTCYECKGSECSNPYYKSCYGAFSCYTSIEIFDKEHLLYQKGCFKHAFVKLTMCHYRNVTTEVTKCCEGNFCNDDEFPSVPAYWTTTNYPSIPDHWMPAPKTEDKNKMEDLDTEKINLTHIVPIVVGLVIAISLVSYVSISRNTSNNRPNLLQRCYNNPSLNDSFASILPSDSRSSMFALNQRCMAQDVTLAQCIGQGRYGEVWKGVWHGENVAVKIFPTRDEASWKNEVDIYTNIALYHENVLGFKGSVITTRCGATEMWLLTAYHEQGSLYDYLTENTITLKEMMEFVRSICSGLLHLHMEIVGSKGKPAIAHRDLKARNILLTSHGTCVIADFGLAIVKTDEISSTDIPINYRVGTKRYMAPEILDDSIKINSFESFKRADIYAFGLILWEICSRCITDNTPEAYRPPFHDCVPNNPDFEDMKKVVCIELKRPEIPDSWSSDKVLNAMATLMKECWHKNPEIRSTVHRVKKTLDKMHADMKGLQSTRQSV